MERLRQVGMLGLAHMMRRLPFAAAVLLAFLSLQGTAQAWHVEGYVYCDANGSGGIDAGDVPVNGIHVSLLGYQYPVQKTTGVEEAPVDGYFYIELPDVSATYGLSISGNTTPLIYPTQMPAQFSVTNASQAAFVDFLLDGSGCRPAHLTVAKTPDGGTFAQGSPFTFTIVVGNDGGGTATNAHLHDQLPGNGGLLWASAASTQGSCVISSTNVLDCNLGNIAPGGTVAVIVSSTQVTPAAACQAQPNPVALATADGGLQAQDSGGVSCTPSTPHLTITKTPDTGIFAQGAPLTFMMVVGNDGNATATNVQLNDQLPGNGGLQWAFAATTQGSCTISAGNLLHCALGDIPAGGSVTVLVDSTQITPPAACQAQPNPIARATAEGGLEAQDSGDFSCTPAPLPCPAGYFTFKVDSAGNLVIIFDQFPAPNDNSYGVNAVGWNRRGHKFTDLVGSDHAGFQLVDPGGVVRLSFNIDYLTANAIAPSGYASLGPFGGDGTVLVGSLTPADIAWTTSLANNLNNVNIPGLFSASHVQLIGSVNVLLDSPPTDPLHQTYNNSDPALTGWDFHDTYYVTLSAAKLASLGFDGSWKVEPNLSALHNSPAKPCPPPPSNGTTLSVTKTEVKDKQVKITVLNSGSVDEVISALQLSWPTTNGKLVQVKLDGDVIYDNPDLPAPSANLTLAELVSDVKKRTIQHGTSDVLTLIFEKNASLHLADYTGTLSTSSFGLTILP